MGRGAGSVFQLGHPLRIDSQKDYQEKKNSEQTPNYNSEKNGEQRFLFQRSCHFLIP